jgi:hypothetical protein
MSYFQRVVTVAVFTGTLLTAIVFAQGGNQGGFGGDDTAGISQVIQSVPSAPLSESERAGLLLMREEEKLARDVYNALVATWTLPLFGNIAESESAHMASVKVLLDRYGIADPVGRDIPGKFENGELQKLYDTLVAQGSRTLDEATKVGATVEDLDIKDLMDLIDSSDNDDIRIVYQNLLKGSRNHLRSFAGRLGDWRTDYQPQFISAELYRKIMSSNRETGTVITDPVYRF